MIVKKKKNVYFNSFRWHLFSYNLLEAKKNDNARNAFDVSVKKNIYIFYQNSEEAYIIENAHLLTSVDFDMDEDVYIFDDKEHWTYIHTHEEECGAYFYSTK